MHINQLPNSQTLYIAFISKSYVSSAIFRIKEQVWRFVYDLRADIRSAVVLAGIAHFIAAWKNLWRAEQPAVS